MTPVADPADGGESAGGCGLLRFRPYGFRGTGYTPAAEKESTWEDMVANRLRIAAALVGVAVVGGCSDSGPQLSCPELLESIRARSANLSRAEDSMMDRDVDIQKKCSLAKASITVSDEVIRQMADFKRRCFTPDGFDQSTLNRATGLSFNATLARSYVKEGLCR